MQILFLLFEILDPMGSASESSCRSTARRRDFCPWWDWIALAMFATVLAAICFLIFGFGPVYYQPSPPAEPFVLNRF